MTTGLLARDRRIHHLGIDFHPRRSTISDANNKRSGDIPAIVQHIEDIVSHDELYTKMVKKA